MINETANEEQIRRADELPAISTGRSRKRDEINDDNDEEVDHAAWIREFFSRDSVIKLVLVVQSIIAILSYMMLNYVFWHLYYLYKGMHLTCPPPTRLLFIIFSPEHFLNSPNANFIYISEMCNILHFTVFCLICLTFAGIYKIFRKRKKLFIFYLLATFPQEMLIFIASFLLLILLLPFLTIGGPMK